MLHCEDNPFLFKAVEGLMTTSKIENASETLNHVCELVLWIREEIDNENFPIPEGIPPDLWRTCIQRMSPNNLARLAYTVHDLLYKQGYPIKDWKKHREEELYKALNSSAHPMNPGGGTIAEKIFKESY